jgi:RNA polymerase sigma-70 factor (ECF subfamily)
VLDEEAFQDFYNRTARGLWVYLARISGSPQLADDLLQETFYRFLRAGTRYESESHRRNSLFRIATNLARDSRRRQVTHAITELPGEGIEGIAGGDSAGAAERSADFTAAMARLNTRERAILWLAYAEGASHQEIADTLGLRTSSMKMLLYRARRKLASLLGRDSGGRQ